MTIGTIVIIVLAIVVLVVLVLGFSTGWKNMWGKITSFLGGGPNVDNIVQACVLACDTEGNYGFCKVERNIRAEGEIFSVKAGTDNIVNKVDGDDKLVDRGKATCFELNKWYSELGIKGCQSAGCPDIDDTGQPISTTQPATQPAQTAQTATA